MVGPKLAVWNPPSLGVLKFNVDGASKGNPGSCGAGGVLRNPNEETLGYFSKDLREGWASEAEVKAILLALQFCHQFCFNSVIIESDSTIVVGWVNSPSNRPSKLRNELNQIDFLLGQVNCIAVHHIFIEANDFAGHLAKEGCGRGETLWFCSDN